MKIDQHQAYNFYIFVLASIFFLMCTENKIESSEQFPNGKATIDIKSDRIEAGQNIPFKISINNLKDPNKIKILLDLPFTNKIIKPSFQNDQYEGVIDSSLTTFSGLCSIVIFFENKILDNKTIQINNQAFVNSIESYAGPKTLEAGSFENSMFNAIVRDKYGNPCGDSLKLTQNFYLPKHSIKSIPVEHHSLLSSFILPNSTIAGKIISSVNHDNISSGQQETSVIPGDVSQLQIGIDEYISFADPREYYEVSSLAIKDNFGNIVADGTIIEFVTKDPLGRKSKYRGFTIDGKARVKIQNPEFSGEVKIQAFGLNGVKSNILNLTFKNYVKEVAVQLNSVSQLVIGPAIGYLDQLIPDGYQIEVDLFLTNKVEKHTLSLKDGTASIDLSEYIKERTITAYTVKLGDYYSKHSIDE